MVNRSPSKCKAPDKGLFRSGMFLKPRMAASLQAILQNSMVHERRLFTVARSQIHPNGLCEIVVKRIDSKVSISSIMEILKRSHDLVQECRLVDPESDSDANKTIEVSDGESICVVTPTRPVRSNKEEPHKTLTSPLARHTVGNNQETFCSNLNIISIPKDLSLSDNNNQLLDPQSSDRKNSLKRTAAESSGNVTVLSSSLAGTDRSDEPMSKRTNTSTIGNCDEVLLVKESDNLNSSVVVLDVSVDARPSAPTWTHSESSILPLSNIEHIFSSKKVTEGKLNEIPNFPSSSFAKGLKGKEITSTDGSAECHTRNSGLGVAKGQSPEITAQKDHMSNSQQGVEQHHFNELTSNISDVSVEIVELSESLPACSQTCSENCSHENHKQCVNLPKYPAPQGGKGKPGVTKSNLSSSECTGSTSSSNVLKLIDHQATAKYTSGDSNDDSSGVSSDEEIIFEKELKSDNAPAALVIDDSDDEIAICKEIFNRKSPKRTKSEIKKGKGQRRQSGIRKISAGTTFVASTSAGPAPDFIPLIAPYRRLDSKFHNPRSPKKNAKLQKIMAKKTKKAIALQHLSIRKGVQQFSKDTPSEEAAYKKKQEYNGNVMNPNSGQTKSGLRPVVIDASNVAIGHGRGHFSVAGLKICIKYFTDRGHKVYAFVPKFRRFHISQEDRKTLDDLEKDGVVSFTPSRTMPDGRKIASYDDRFIVQTAAELGGVVVSTDNYRDLLAENESWRETIEQRLLMFTWVGDLLLFPNDPLGRNGPHLIDFLRFPEPASS